MTCDDSGSRSCRYKSEIKTFCHRRVENKSAQLSRPRDNAATVKCSVVNWLSQLKNSWLLFTLLRLIHSVNGPLWLSLENSWRRMKAYQEAALGDPWKPLRHRRWQRRWIRRQQKAQTEANKATFISQNCIHFGVLCWWNFPGLIHHRTESGGFVGRWQQPDILICSRLKPVPPDSFPKSFWENYGWWAA